MSLPSPSLRPSSRSPPSSPSSSSSPSIIIDWSYSGSPSSPPGGMWTDVVYIVLLSSPPGAEEGPAAPGPAWPPPPAAAALGSYPLLSCIVLPEEMAETDHLSLWASLASLGPDMVPLWAL